MKILTRNLAAIALASLLSATAHAGPYADDMGRCLVRETGQAERTAIMKWLFAAMALHPDVHSMSTIDAAARDSINRDVGTLFQRLLVESCRTESTLAIKNEGMLALQSAFSVLGQVAMRELMANPDVNAGLAELEKYVDQKRIAELGPAAPAPAPASTP